MLEVSERPINVGVNKYIHINSMHSLYNSRVIIIGPQMYRYTVLCEKKGKKIFKKRKKERGKGVRQALHPGLGEGCR